MDLQLANKTALVSGSTAGIGFAIADLLAKEGAMVVINGRSEARVQAAIQKIKEKNPAAKLNGVVADLTQEDGLKALFYAVPTVDILVNSLGIYEIKSFFEISDADWLRLFNTNVMSGIRLSRQYLGPMLKANWGRIIFISSESGIQIPVEMIHYGMTKTAELAVARGLAEMTAGTNVTVNSVLPGPTASEGVNRFLDQAAKEHQLTPAQIEKEFFTTMRPTSLLKRFTTPDEVAALVAYLCSPLSAATNGAAMRADGGVVKGIY
jgi:NAD(P)-dependent dehydrogenase (short-subunit alcohol dehydrogenase family)